uniref:Kinetochore protein Nuf2 N-terminal domain-containing protein n=1 Tax=Panagrolaimus sp. PS1159 TaxID=55785 RepID=A0AC35G3U5_9BILA
MSAQTEKIINFFAENYSHVGLTAESLKKPTFDTVFEAYRCLTCSIFGFADSIFYPDENEPQTPLQILLRLMQSVINDTTPENFLLTDLIMPKSARFRFFLGSLIDFLIFLKEHVNEIDTVFEDMNNLRKKVEDDRLAIAKLGDEIQKQKQKNELAKRKKLDLSSKVSQLEAKLQANQKEKDDIKEKVATIEKQMEQKKEKTETLDAAIDEANEECRQLDLDIISSPDKIFNEIKQTEELIAKSEEKINDFKKQARDSARKKADAETLEKKVQEIDNKMSADIDATLKLVNERKEALKESVADLQNRNALVSKTESDCTVTKNETEEKFRKLKADGEFLQANIDCAKEKLSTLQQGIDRTYEDAEYKDKKDRREMTAKLKQLQQTLDEMEANYQQREQTLANLMNEISSFVQTEEDQQKESTIAYEKAIAEIKGDETLNEISKLLEQNVELANRKRELENNRNLSS